MVRNALEQTRLTKEVRILSEEVDQHYRMVIGESETMARAIGMAKRAAKSKATVLLLGESGTGKEIFARAIHKWSNRREEAFVTVNCVGLSRELLESELFGHEKGAFTGAHQLKRGRLELAHKGTVFFDEVGDISAELQTKLLRVLQERNFERVGGTQSIAVDIRIVGATNRDLETMVVNRMFREDLYHRLNVVSITLPPLRERPEDIFALAEYFIHKYSREGGRDVSRITPEALAGLLAYHWPGNVRELANTIERAIVLGSGPSITLHDASDREWKATGAHAAENSRWL